MDKEYRIGLMTCLACGIIWGVLVLYWDALNPIPSSTVIFYRIFLVGFMSTVIAVKAYGKDKYMETLRDRKAMLLLTVTGLLITLNWSVYIWAVKAGFVIQTCVGYYIEPLAVAVFGIIFFKERLSGFKLTAFILAVIGLIVLLIHFREVPTIALVLAFSFATYAAMQKKYDMPSILMLSYQTGLIAIPALIIIIALEVSGNGAIGMEGVGAGKYLLLLCSGPFTTIPLFLFGVAATRVSLVTMGIFEYISPSLALILGIFVLHEAFDGVQFIAFVIVWIGLVFFTAGEIRETRQMSNINVDL